MPQEHHHLEPTHIGKHSERSDLNFDENACKQRFCRASIAGYALKRPAEFSYRRSPPDQCLPRCRRRLS